MRFTTILFLSLLLSGCSTHKIPAEIQNDLDSLVFRWVPDNREGVCQYTLSRLSGNSVVLKGETSIPEAKDEIIALLSDKGFEVTDSLKTLPDESVEKNWGLVTVSVCNIRSKPSFSGEQVSQALMGTPVKILKISNGWLMIQTPDHYLGWTNDSGITEMIEDEISAWRQSKRIIYTCKSGDIVSETDRYDIVSDITAGAILERVSENRDYFIVELPDGRRGMIERNMAADFDDWCSSSTPDPERLIQFAKSLKGSPYMWGGTSTKAIDCSGFVKTIFFTGGIILARDASQQFLYGEPVDLSSPASLKPGDLIFFGHLNENGSKRITHVGMYIGDTEVIHSSGMVRVNSLDSTRANFNGYLLKTMMGARRIIGEESRKGIESAALHNWYVNK